MKGILECGDVAFPNSGAPRHADGMTLRDYFAAAALQGTLAAFRDISATLEAGQVAKRHGVSILELAARAAYEQADAMLAERIK